MIKLSQSVQNQRVHWVIIILLALYQVIRLIAFANTYGGVEHDSGWFLGISRSLAERGSYTTMVSSVADPTPGRQQNIYGQYKVQDEEGRIYFFPESIGPSSIIPNAIIIKLFGSGFWQYRTGPLLFFTASMLLTSYLLYQVGGFLPVLITHLFLLFYPHLIIFLGYETMGEIFSLAYILLAFILLMTATRAKMRRPLWFFACGTAAGLVIIDKLVGLLVLSGLTLVWGLLYWEKRTVLKEGLALIGGWALPPILWELTQLLSLTFLFDFQTYQRYLMQHLDFFLNEGGSGIGEQNSGNLAFLWHKMLIVKEISLTSDVVSFIVLLIIFLSGPFLIQRFYKDILRRNLVILLWAGWLIHSLWFIALSKTGWVRHDWYALILGVFLLSLITSHFWQQINKSPKWFNRMAAFFLTGLLLTGFITQANSVNLFVFDELVDRWHQQHLASNHTRIPWMIVPRLDQEEALAVLQQLPASARVFYPEGHKSAEMAVMSGRILYPIQRRPFMPPDKDDVVLIGPSLISRWRKPTEAHISQADQQAFITEVLKQVKRECPRVTFENSYYIICALD